ncbi:hypothetical protein [Sporosarcina sp. FSL K6-3457]|uniref:hypothetical protein n=1 Tax=Sporosarcina sp. FSL K6-3457 TaxID=2978204 RepID=UPI0030FCEE7D
MIEINEFRNRREGKVTPSSLIEGLSERADPSEIETLVYVAKMRNGDINTAFSHALNSEHIGLLEIGKMQIIDSMRE